MLPAHLAVQAAHAIDRAAAAHGQIGHVERLGRSSGFRRPSASRSSSEMPSSCSRITAEYCSIKLGSETVEAGCHRRVGGEEIAGARDGRAPRRRAGRFLAMKLRARSSTANAAWPSFRWQTSGCDAERPQQAPAADAEHHFLHEAQLRAAAVQFAGDAAIRGKVGGVVGIEQIQLRAADLHLPGADPDWITRQRISQPQPFAVRICAAA